MRKFVIGLLAFIGFLTLSGCQKTANPTYLKTPYTQNEFVMGTTCTLTIYDKGKKSALKDGFAMIHHVDAEATLTRGGSVLDKINDNAGIKPVKVPKDFMPLLEKAYYFSKNSNGSFDMAIGAVTNLWQIGLPGARVPAQSEIDKALPLVNWRDVKLDTKNNTAYLTKKGMRLDFGGIAKGWVADKVKAVLAKDGVTAAIIDLGGNVVVMGHSPLGTNRDWHVGIQDPTAPRGTAVGTIPESNESIVTAGTYEQYLISNVHKYIYLFDPQTGYPYDNNLASVTIVSKNSVDGDALSNAAFDKGLKGGLQYMNAKNSDHIQAIFITNDKKIYLTNGLKKQFKFDADSGYHKGNF